MWSTWDTYTELNSHLGISWPNCFPHSPVKNKQKHAKSGAVKWGWAEASLTYSQKIVPEKYNFPGKENWGGGERPTNQNMYCSPLLPLPRLYPFSASVGPKNSSGLIFTLLYVKSYPPWKSLLRFLRIRTTRCLSRKRVECWNSRDSLCSECSLDNGSCIHKNTVINRAKGSDFGQRTARFSPLTCVMSEFRQFSS